MEKLFDVVAVEMETHKVELMAEKQTERNADAIVMMSVERRGVETHFYITVSSGKYKNGDEWNPDEGGYNVACSTTYRGFGVES